jgi:hypothetical protein
LHTIPIQNSEFIVQNSDKGGNMFTDSQNRCIARKVVSAITKALDAWPALLDAADADAAAEIVAGIIKAQLARPVPPTDPQAALDSIIQSISDNAIPSPEDVHPEPS